MDFLTSTSNFVPYCTYYTICEISTGTVINVDNDYPDEDIEEGKNNLLLRLKREAIDDGGNGLFNIHYNTAMTNTVDMNGYPSDNAVLLLVSANVVKARMLSQKQISKNEKLLQEALSRTKKNFNPSKHDDSGKQNAIRDYNDKVKDSVKNKQDNKSSGTNGDSDDGLTFIPPCFWI